MPQPVAPSLSGPTSSRKSAEGVILASSLVVGMIYAYRKLFEPAAATTQRATTNSAIRKVIGLEPAPANVGQFAVAFGFTFLTLSLVALAAPEVASAGAILVATGDVLTNGASVFTDITSQVTETTKPTTTAAAPAKGPGK